ncbi:MAG: TetR/AcrR family transcriptional regulator, partial [Clostridiales bacterium]|nr:TetR/AcrR family transcriptional regulator [Clostridiales bacterium]
MTRKNNPKQTVESIIDIATKLFMEKGYEHTTMQDIVDGLGMSKGAIFYHFKSKDDILDAVVKRMIRQLESAARAIANDTALTAHEKMRQIISAINISDGPNGGLIEELHRPDNAMLHQRSISGTIDMLAPIMADVITQGMEEGVYHTAYPLETIEFILAGDQLVFDAGFFQRTTEELQSRVAALARN